MTREWFGHRFTALLVVLALHVLFLLLLLAREPIPRTVAHDARSSVLFFIEPPQPSVTRATSTPARAVQRQPSAVDQPSTAEQTSVASSSVEPPATIDWTTQAAEAAAALVDRSIREQTRKCDPSDSPNSFLPPCNPRTKKFEWKPEQPRVGFSGGLPYVRLGERCAVGLGFFSCAIGRLPSANGDLFEGMSDPERDRSSVPPPSPPSARQ